MGLHIIRTDPVTGKRKTREELQRENEALAARVAVLEGQIGASGPTAGKILDVLLGGGEG